MPLASFSGCIGQFESYLVANPEDRFSRDEAHMKVTDPAKFLSLIISIHSTWKKWSNFLHQLHIHLYSVSSPHVLQNLIITTLGRQVDFITDISSLMDQLQYLLFQSSKKYLPGIVSKHLEF